MKNKFFYPVLAVAFVMVFTTSCSSSDDSSTTTAPIVDTTPIINTVSQGTWRVTKYIDHTKNETADFGGYTFTFGDGNVLTATNGPNTYTGVWSVVSSNSSDDDSPDDSVDFNIIFTAPADFEDISDDWDILSRTATKIELVDDSKNSSEIDYLTFEKN